jgi:hypothetical protein
MALRASDADRERVATMLRDSYMEGRLDDAEFQERLEKTYVGKTLAELAVLTADLPVRTEAAASTPMPVEGPSLAVAARERILRYVIIMGFLVAIWAATGRHGSFWPIWPIVIGGFFTALSILNMERSGLRRRQRWADRYRRIEERTRGKDE